MTCQHLMSKRRAGVLCHITSLPGSADHGDIGPAAYQFIDFLADCGLSVWQILPLEYTHDNDLSPYNSISAHAANTKLVSIDLLMQQGWLSRQDYIEFLGHPGSNSRKSFIRKAYHHFKLHATQDEQTAFKQFIADNLYWLDTFSYFINLREQFNHAPWNEWPDLFRDCHKETLEHFRSRHIDEFDFVYFEQFCFHVQWQALKSYANKKGVLLIGDIPIFVAYDSADVWAHRRYFYLDGDGLPLTVAGVPPDYFSELGQRWGNPHYHWQNMQDDNFSWWQSRVKVQNTHFDAVRIDHFRGLSQYWAIPADEENAVNGYWADCPGRDLLTALTGSFPHLCLIAEDLGTITEDVTALRDQFGIPGMTVFQFAFDGSPDNPHLPDNYLEHSIAYTGTHDNDTTLSWYESLNAGTRDYVNSIAKGHEDNAPWPMIEAILESIANITIVPLQDLLGLGAGARMNTPGTSEGNWLWRFEWTQLTDDIKSKITHSLIEADRK